MCKKTIAIIMAGLAMGALTSAYAAGPVQNIRWTVHNLSNDPALSAAGFARHQISAGENQICIFCHTPHNAKPAVPLWNKVLPDATIPFNMYTSSATLSATARKASTPSIESLLCLSCHDGRTAINVEHNSKTGDTLPNGEHRTDIGGLGSYESVPYMDPYTDAGGNRGWYLADFSIPGSDNGKNLGALNRAAVLNDPYGNAASNYYGRNLTDDHPISFSMAGAYTDKGSAYLNNPATIVTGVKFYGSNMRIECGSCHDPHVAYGRDANGNPSAYGNPIYRPFLRVDNTGSKLCLSCHNK